MHVAVIAGDAIARCVLANLPPILARAGGGNVFVQPEDVVLMWAERAALVVALSSVVLVLFVLLKRRRRLMEGQSKWLLFLGLCVFPVPVALLSAGIGMEESKKVEFCHSCHASMDPFVDDMMDPDSDYLAAVHYKNRLIQSEHCWSCHSDYGISGTTEAKLSGLRDITKAVLNTWEAPIRLRHPYKWAICLDCHGNSASFLDEAGHEDVIAGVLQGETTCSECHELSHLPPDERSSK